MTKEMTKQLKRMVTPDRHHCDCCGFEHNCQIHGCAVLRQAVKEVETLAQITTAVLQAALRDVEPLAQITTAVLQAALRDVETLAQITTAVLQEE